jgi:hypothetical protein
MAHSKAISLAFLLLGLVAAPPLAGACNPTEECSHCAAYAPRICVFHSCSGGQCIQHYNAPDCEARKAACNACMLPLITAGMDAQVAARTCL